MAIGLLHPGEMGAAVGKILTDGGQEVIWASTGRSPESEARANAANLIDVGWVKTLAARAEWIFSICPPHAALAVAQATAEAGFKGVYVDANAVAPATARTVCEVLVGSGATYVDAAIIGPPPHAVGTTRLYLSGGAAAGVAEPFQGTALAPVVLDEGPFAPSALKMAYAAWTKGSTALLLAALSSASANGVEDALRREWAISLPDLSERARSAETFAASKGWRWVGEMEEIAATFAKAGLPDGFHLAAAEIYRRFPCGGLG